MILCFYGGKWVLSQAHLITVSNNSLTLVSGNSYRALGLKDKFASLTRDQALDLLAADGMLIKRPILEKDGKILQIGYRTEYATLDL